jgi:uncharacterized protein YegJ (DUF2314 family)
MGLLLVAWFVYNQFYPTPEFRREFRSVFQLILPIVFIRYGWRWIRYEGRGIEDTPGNASFPELDESVAQARAALPEFVVQIAKNTDGAYIKFRLITAQGLKEHIWAYVHSYDGQKFNVSLANTPRDSKEPAEGRRDVHGDEVEDWQILLPDGRIKGAYSTMALFRNGQNCGKPLSPKMRKQKALLVDFPS